MLLSESLSQKERPLWFEASAVLAVESLAKHLAAASESDSLASCPQQRESLVAEIGYSQPHSYNHLCQQLGSDFLRDFQAYQNGTSGSV